MGSDLRAAWIIVRGIVASKASRPRELLGNIIVNSLDVIAPVLGFTALVHAFGTLGGWSMGEVWLLLGMANSCIGLSLLTLGAFDSFLFVPIYRNGQFESALMRPGNTITFLAASNVRPYRVGRVFAGLIVLIVGAIHVVPQNWALLAVLPLSISIGSAMLCTMWMVDASAVIRLGQPNDLTRNMPFVATEMSFFPQGVYPPPARIVSQLIFGLGSATYLPVAYLLGRGPNFGIFSLLIAPALLPVMIAVGRAFWRSAVRSFESGGAK